MRCNTVCDFEDWFHDSVAILLHSITIFYEWQVHSSPILITLGPAASHYPIPHQQKGSLNSTSPVFTDTDHSLLHAMSPAYIFNEVCDFQNGFKQDIMFYQKVKDDWQYEIHTNASIHGTEAVLNPHYSPLKLDKLCYLSSLGAYKHP